MVSKIALPTQTIGVLNFLSSFSFGRFIWKWYENFAVRQMQRYKVKLQKIELSIQSFTTQQAKKELKNFDTMVKWFERVKRFLDILEDDTAFAKFYQSFLEVYYLVLDIQTDLEDISEPHYYAQLSQSALSEDWDSEEDSHWDNYKPITS